MEIEVFNEENYNLHILKTKRFKTVDVILNYIGKRTLKSDVCLSLLEIILLYVTQDYPNKIDFVKALGEMYDLRLETKKQKWGKYDNFSFRISLINEKYTEKDMNKKSIEFGLHQFFNPLVKENKFDKDVFEMARKLMISDLEGEKNLPDYYAMTKIKEYLGKEEFLCYNSSEKLNCLKEINEEELYSFYKKMLDEYKLEIFVIGDVSLDVINDVFNKKISKRHQNKEKYNYEISFEKVKKEPSVFSENIAFSQSKIEIGFKIKDLTNFEKQYVSFIYNSLLGGGTDSLLFNEVRGKNSLCYYIYTYGSSRNSFGVIRSGVNNENIDEVIKLSLKCVNDIKDGNFDESLIEKAKKCYANALYENEDFADMVLMDYINSYFYNTDSMKERMKKINEVSKEDVINFAKKIHIDTIFILKGGDYGNKDI